MIQLLIKIGPNTLDYTKFVDQSSLQIQEQINLPSQCTFTLIPIGNFIKPPQRAYVTVFSTRYQKSLFTGFIAAEPQRTLLSTGRAQELNLAGGVVEDVNMGPRQLFSYAITATSDEYLLNIKAIPFIPSYYNRSQGDILSSLAETLCPGFFDTSQIASGDIVPYFAYSPQQSWAEVAKLFGDGSRYRYKARDRQLYYQPFGDQPLGIVYDESQPQSQFNAQALQTSVLTVPIVNDVTIIGDTEAGNNREDYFLGDGFTGNFQLLHKVFRGSSTLLVNESWNNTTLNTQTWFAQDPGDNFDYSAGALNVLTASGLGLALGDSQITLNNGLELSGGVVMDGGEFIFTDYCNGLVNAIYTDSSLSAAATIAAFQLSSPFGVGAPGISGGVGGVHIQPYFSGQAVGAPLVSQANHTYVLQLMVTLPKYTRYTQFYRTVEGEQFGGSSELVPGSITWQIQDYDMFAATGFFYSPKITQQTMDGVNLPPFVAYALINNVELNVSIVNTSLSNMVMGSLQALVGPSGLYMPTGLILPMLPPGSGGYIGGVAPWPSIASGTILPPPGNLVTGGVIPGPGVLPFAPVTGAPLNLIIANGYQLQAAQITQGNESDQLSFYAQSLPAAGTPVRLQSFEAQAAVSRLQDADSIAAEAFVVGDDGIRSCIVTNLNPLPRTSEDCDAAGQAYLKDRDGVTYNGTYTMVDTPSNKIFNGLTADLQFWPTVGRFLNVNTPRRGILQQKMLVSQLTITFLDMFSETLQYAIQFGADTYLDKVLKNFVDLTPASVLTAKDQANPPNPRLTQNVDNSFLPDLNNVQADMTMITPTSAAIKVRDPYFGAIEIRRLDTNWGQGATSDLIGVVLSPAFTLARQQFDQAWFMRPVSLPFSILSALAASGAGHSYDADQWSSLYQTIAGISISPDEFGTVLYYLGLTPATRSTIVTFEQFIPAILQAGAYTNAITSRRSKVIRIKWPTKPSPPLFQSYQSGLVQFLFNGDYRNIYGFELRADLSVIGVTGGVTVLLQQPCPSVANLNVDIFNGTPLGTFPGNQNLSVSGYFFNQNWVYSDPIVIPVASLLPPAPQYSVGLQQYGLFGITGLATPQGLAAQDIQSFNIALVYVDETQASLLNGTLTSPMDGVTDPVIIAPTINSSGALQFLVGDHIVFNDSSPVPTAGGFRSYECATITAIDGGGNFTIQRAFPGSPAGKATFESLVAPHAAGIKFYKLQTQYFPQNLQTGTLQAQGSTGLVPPAFWVTWPTECIVAALCAFANTNGYGPWTTLNCANFQYTIPAAPVNIPSAPGLRTLAGGGYTMTGFGYASGNLKAGQRADAIAKLTDNDSIRVITAYMNDAGGVPLGGDGIVVNVRYTEPMQPSYTSYSQRRSGTIETLQIQDSQGTSYDNTNNPPGPRRMPYTHTWPTTDIMGDDGSILVLQQGGDLDFEIIEVGSMYPGSGLIISVQK